MNPSAFALTHALFYELELLFRARVLPGRANQTVLDVALDCCREQDWFLADEANLGAEPLEVQVTNIHAVE